MAPDFSFIARSIFLIDLVLSGNNIQFTMHLITFPRLLSSVRYKTLLEVVLLLQRDKCLTVIPCDNDDINVHCQERAACLINNFNLTFPAPVNTLHAAVLF